MSSQDTAPDQSLSNGTDAIVGLGDTSHLPVGQRAVTRPQNTASFTANAPTATETTSSTANQENSTVPLPNGPSGNGPTSSPAAPIPVFTPQNPQVTALLVLHNRVSALGYELDWTDGLLPDRQWKALALIDGVAFCDGIAQNKQGARQNAAMKTLAYLLANPRTLPSRRPVR